MAIHQETKNKIIDLYFKEHLRIREIAKITKKSSRDIVGVLRNSEHKGKAEENKNIHGNNTPTPKKETGGHRI